MKQISTYHQNLQHKRKQIHDYFDWVKSLPCNPTPAEKEAIALFKADKMLKDFIFQVPIYFNEKKKFIMDFFSVKYLTCIEIDGEYHYNKPQYVKDYKRFRRMRMKGIRTIRIKNENILTYPAETIKQLKQSLLKQKSTKAQRRMMRYGNPHRIINRVLKHIDSTLFGLPSSIRKRRVTEYADRIPAYIVNYFTEHPDSIRKRGTPSQDRRRVLLSNKMRGVGNHNTATDDGGYINIH